MQIKGSLARVISLGFRVLVLTVFVLFGILNFVLFPRSLNSFDLAVEESDLGAMNSRYEQIKTYAQVLPHKSGYVELLKAQIDFITVRGRTIQDVKGALFFLESLKARVQRSLEMSWFGLKDQDLQRRSIVILSAISSFQNERLRSGLNQLQQEAIKYQIDSQVKAYETFGKSIDSASGDNKKAK